MKQFRDRTAVITGAASGIGLELARRAAAEGMRLVLADIEFGRLQEAAATGRVVRWAHPLHTPARGPRRLRAARVLSVYGIRVACLLYTSPSPRD